MPVPNASAWNIWPQRDLSDGRWFCEITAVEDDAQVLHETFSFEHEREAVAAAEHWIERQVSVPVTVPASEAVS